jgi:hypothetical protein
VGRQFREPGINSEYINIARGLLKFSRPVLNIVPNKIAFMGQIFLRQFARECLPFVPLIAPWVALENALPIVPGYLAIALGITAERLKSILTAMQPPANSNSLIWGKSVAIAYRPRGHRKWRQGVAGESSA